MYCRYCGKRLLYGEACECLEKTLYDRSGYERKVDQRNPLEGHRKRRYTSSEEVRETPVLLCSLAAACLSLIGSVFLFGLIDKNIDWDPVPGMPESDFLIIGIGIVAVLAIIGVVILLIGFKRLKKGNTGFRATVILVNIIATVIVVAFFVVALNGGRFGSTGDAEKEKADIEQVENKKTSKETKDTSSDSQKKENEKKTDKEKKKQQNKENIKIESGANCKVVVDGGTKFKVGETLHFTAVGEGMDIKNPVKGDMRYKPIRYEIEGVGDSFISSNYSASLSCNTAGTYTLSVYFRPAIYGGDGKWQYDETNEKRIDTTIVVE